LLDYYNLNCSFLRVLDRKELCCFNFKRGSNKYFEIPLGYFFGNFLGPSQIQPKVLGWDGNGSNPLNLERKCHLHAEFLHANGCGRFQDGKRKSKLALMEVKRGWFILGIAGKIFHDGWRWWRHWRWRKRGGNWGW